MSSNYPSRWNLKPLGDVAEIIGGGTPSRNKPEYWGKDNYWITPSEVVKADGKSICQSKEQISNLGLQSSSAKLHPPGTVLMTSRASIGFAAIASNNICTNQGFQSLRCGSTLDNWFALHQIRYKRSELQQLAAGSTFLEISATNVRNFPFLIPPLKEQKLIAEVLNDTDILIESLSKLFEKKHHIKNCVAEELLSGKTRLPGFNQKWEFKKFGDIFNFLSTASNSRSQLSENGDAYYVHYGDIHTKFHNHLNLDKINPPKIFRSKCKNASLLKNNDWIMVDASEDFEGIGKAIEIKGLKEKEEIIAGLHTFALREKLPIFAPGFKGHLGNLKFLHDQFLRIATGLKVYSISKTTISNLELPVPSIEEQKKITKILDDMEDELIILKARQTNAQNLKIGIMQELLSGKISLIE